MSASDIPKLRGFFARKFPQDHLFHNHLPGGEQSFSFPLIQYRLIDGCPALLGIGEGIDVLKKVFFEVNELEINGRMLSVNERQVTLLEDDFGQCDTPRHYKFISPWMALNQENDSEYYKLAESHRRSKLLKILSGNLVTLSKGFHYTIPDRDTLKADGTFREVDVNFHNIPMHCFYGDFSVNFMIPDFFGLGKQTARGFGVLNKKEVR
jgi:hypothetical protein